MDLEDFAITAQTFAYGVCLSRLRAVNYYSNGVSSH